MAEYKGARKAVERSEQLVARLEASSGLLEEFNWEDWPNLDYPPALMAEAAEMLQKARKLARDNRSMAEEAIASHRAIAAQMQAAREALPDRPWRARVEGLSARESVHLARPVDEARKILDGGPGAPHAPSCPALHVAPSGMPLNRCRCWKSIARNGWTHYVECLDGCGRLPYGGDIEWSAKAARRHMDGFEDHRANVKEEAR